MRKHSIKLGKTLKNCYLCIRFPFLYPRNVFSDRHYTNHKLDNKMRDLYKKWSEWAAKHQELYFNEFGKDSLLDFESEQDVLTPEDFTKSFVKCEYVMKLPYIPLKERFLYRMYGVLNDFLGIFHIIPKYTWFGSIPEGWRKRFGIQFCKELKEAIYKSGGRKLMKTFRILDIKEKWGRFIFYANSYTEEVDRVIKKYEYISKFVCVECGEDAVKMTTGWICPYCEKCLPPNRKWLWIDPIYGWSSTDKYEENKKIKEGWRQ